MNAAGGGTNKPKVVDNKVYASVGGYDWHEAASGFGKKGTPDPRKKRKVLVVTDLSKHGL